MNVFFAICLNLLILAVFIWVVSMCLEMIVASTGLPAQVRPIVLALVGLFGLLAIFGGYRIPF